MTDERKEHILFMAEGGESREKISLVHPEREAKAQAARDKTITPRNGGQPPERSAPPAPSRKDGSSEVVEFSPFPERDARQDQLITHISEGRDKEAIGMMLEDEGLNPEEEFQKPEVQKVLQDLDIFKEEMSKPEGERDMSRLEAASAAFREAPKQMQDLLRPMLRFYGVGEDDVKRMLPETPVAPTEEGEEAGEGHGITAPTEDDQRTEEEREVEAAVKPFVQNIEDRIAEGDWKGAQDDIGRLRDKLKEIPWGKIAGRSAQGVLIAVVATYVAYIFLMAKANGLAGKR